MEIATALLTPDSPVIETVLAWHWHEWSAEDADADIEKWRERLHSRSRLDRVPFTLVARLDGDIVGCVTVCDDDDKRYADRGPWLSGMLVIGPARNLGVGRRLLRDAAAHARDLGATELWLYTAEAARFYERCGYRFAHQKHTIHDNAVRWREL